MKQTYIDPDGVENVAVGIIERAKKDFIKGAKILYRFFKRIPEEAEVLADNVHKTLVNDKDVKMTYDSWRFVKKDPYYMFEDVGEKSVIEAWKFDSIVAYYQDLYIEGAVDAYRSGFEKKKKELYEISESSLKKNYIKNKNKLDDFIAARNYILTLDDGFGRLKLDEWNLIAYERSKRKPKTGVGRSYVAEQRKQEREKNKRKAIELSKSGLSIKAIAKYMGVGDECIRRYLREADSK